MKSLQFFVLSALGALSLLLTACGHEGNDTADAAKATSNPDQVFHWKMVTTWPPNFPIFQEGVDRLASDLRTMSRGRLDIQVYAAGQLVPALGIFDAVSQGTVEMGHGAAYYWAGKVPAAQFMSSVPFGMTAKDMHAWLYWGGGLDLWRELYKPYNLVPFPVGNSGVQMGGWFNKEINSLADLKGLKMRIPGLGGKVLSAAGGSPVLMAGGELYTALERGTIDATEWVGPFHDERLGLQRAAKYYYYPGWHEPGTELELIINQPAWDSLPEDLKKMVETAATANSLLMHSHFEELNLKALAELRQRGVDIREFPADVLAELNQLSTRALDELAQQDPTFKRVYDSYQSFRAQAADWDNISEGAYRRAVERLRSPAAP